MLAAGSMLDHDGPTLIRSAAAAGFDGAGLRLSAEHGVHNEKEARGLASLADDLGVAVHDTEVIRITSDWRPASPSDDATRLLDLSAEVGATSVLVVSDSTDEELTTDAVASLVDLAKPLGLAIGLEYMAWTTPSTPTAAQRLATETGCRVIIDLLHHVRLGAGSEEIAAMAEADQLAWIQLCDATSTTTLDLDSFDREATIHEARHGRLPPGAGVLPINDLLAPVMASRQPNVTFSVEVQSDELASLGPDERARLLWDSVRRTLGRS